MIHPKLPYSFLVEALTLSPDDFIREMAKHCSYKSLVDSMNDVIEELTKINVNMKTMRLYNTETLEAWNSFVKRNKWDNVKDETVSSLFEFVRSFGKECLVLNQDEPVFKIDKTKIWQSVSFQCGEDLFVTSQFATKYIEDNYSPHNYQWSYILKSDFYPLNNIISNRKIVENHYHLWGSAPNIDLSWIYLMNHPYGQSERFDKLLNKDTSYYGVVSSYQDKIQYDVYTLIKIAARIRLWLFQTCVLGIKNENAYVLLSNMKDILDVGTDFDAVEMEESIGLYRFKNKYRSYDTTVDYAIDDDGILSDKNNSFIAGERRLYYKALTNIYKYNNSGYNSDEVQVLLYIYILIKNRFSTVFIQSNEKSGFQNFKEYQDRKGILIDNTPYQSMAAKMAIKDNINENCLKQLEVRIGPQNTSQQLSKSIKWIDDNVAKKQFELICSDTNEVADITDKYFYVIHFLKGRKMVWSGKSGSLPVCREYYKRKDFEKQAKAIRELRKKRLYGAYEICGIDAASNEVNFRPECLGQVFRYLTNTKTDNESHFSIDDKQLPDLHKTYHVGEDFYDIIDGLRAIDEAIRFLELGNGDRIGHGVVLGLDVNAWYKRHPQVAIPTQNILDNIAWALDKIRKWNLNITADLYAKLKMAFDNYYDKIYYCDKSKDNYGPDLLSYIKAWKMRGDNPDCYSSTDFDQSVLKDKSLTEWDRCAIRKKHAFKDLKDYPIVYNIIHRYHFDARLKELAREVVCYTASPEYVELTRQLQIKMRNYVLEKGVAVESCPSSNFLISNLDDFKEIPTFKLFPIVESQDNFIRLNVSINTDDQGIFFTSLQKEYAMLAGTLREERDEKGLRIHSDDKILNWIEHLINNGKQQCFRSIDV